MRPVRSWRGCSPPMARQVRRLDAGSDRNSYEGYEEIEMANLQKIVDEPSGLTVLEAAELAKLLEEKWGVSAAAPVAMMAAGVGAAPAAAAEEKTEFNVILASIGATKL